MRRLEILTNRMGQRTCGGQRRTHAWVATLGEVERHIPRMKYGRLGRINREKSGLSYPVCVWCADSVVMEPPKLPAVRKPEADNDNLGQIGP